MTTAATVWKNPQNSILGAIPSELVGTAAVDGDAVPWVQMRAGSRYILLDDTNEVVTVYRKWKDDGADNDWGTDGVQVIAETFGVADMTDATATTGTYALTKTIPVGAFVLGAACVNVTGFAGDTSATIQVGDGTDADRYSTGTPSVFATAAAVDLGVRSGAPFHATAKTVTVTITSASDFSDVITDGSGQATIKIFYVL